MSKSRNQTSEILKHLMDPNNDGITSKQAFDLYGCTRLSAKIFNLRKLGYDIETQMVVGYTRYGDTCEYAKYIYMGELEDE